MDPKSIEEEARKEQLRKKLNLIATVIMVYEHMRRPQPHISRDDLLDPDGSPLMRLLAHGDDLTYEKFLRIDRATFTSIYRRFQPTFEARPLRDTEGDGIHALHSRPSARALCTPLVLGLVLRFLASGIESDDQLLQLGITQSTRSLYLRSGLLALLHCLRSWSPARIQLPSVAEARVMADHCQQYQPLLAGCFGVIDGTVHRRERPADDQVQRLHYNGMDCCHAAKSLLVVGISGEIIFIVINDWGSSSDAGTLKWCGFLDLLAQYPPDLFIIGDSAFPAGPNLVRVIGEEEMTEFVGEAQARVHVLNTVLKRVRTAAEWGIRQWKGCWRFFHHELAAEADTDIIYLAIFEITARLTNVRVRLMHRGEVGNVFQ